MFKSNVGCTGLFSRVRQLFHKENSMRQYQSFSIQSRG